MSMTWQEMNERVKQNGYRWVLKAPTGEIVSIQQALRQIRSAECHHNHDLPREPTIDLAWEGKYSSAVTKRLDLISIYGEGQAYVIFPQETTIEYGELIEGKPHEYTSKRYILPDGTVFVFQDNYLCLQGEQ